VKEETSYAKQLYLHGEGSQKPIKNVKLLSEASGAPIETLRPWIPKWRRESTELALRSDNSPYSIALSEETLAQHRKEIGFLGVQVEKLRRKLESTPTGHANFVVYLSAYQSALTKWEKSSGITAQYDVVLSSMKESARSQARAMAKLGNTKGHKSPSSRPNAARFNTG
jgi:hypothetical protein